MRKISDLNFPILTKRLKRFMCKHYLSLSRDKKYDPTVNDVQEFQVIVINLNNKTHISPEYSVDNKWHKFYINGEPLVSLLPNMLGVIQNRHKIFLILEWHKWLNELINLNNLNIKIKTKDKIKIPLKLKEEIKNIDKDLTKLSRDNFIEDLSPKDKMHLIGRPYLRNLFKNRPLPK